MGKVSNLIWKNNKIKIFLTIRGMTQQQLADKLGITQASLNHYIYAKREPTIEMISRICTALDIKNIKDLFFENE